MGILHESIQSLHKKLIKREMTSTDIVKATFDRIHEVDDRIQAFLTLNEEKAYQEAAKWDQKYASEENLGLLAGLPIGIKDNIITKNLRTTCASKILYNFDPIYNATVMEKLNTAGMITVGKINMDEFAMGSSNENSAFKPVHNPWNLDYVPGGSSGGSAAAVAAGEVLYALGSDTGGSIRQPASYCGVVGLKPTYGRISRFGLVAFASSLDQIGPITKTVEDNAYLLEVLAGVDPMDCTSANLPVPKYFESLNKGVKGLRIAVPKEYLGEGVLPEVRESILEALKIYEKMGAIWEEVSLPHSKYALSTYYLLSSSEASANLSRFDGVRYGYRSKDSDNLMEMYKNTRAEGFGDEVKRRIMLGTFALSSGYYDAYYKKAQKVRTLIKQDFEKVFEQFDVIIGPTAPTPAFQIGENTSDPMTMYANDILTIPVSLAGVPAISIPCGFMNHLPLGLQIIGKHFDEAMVYRVAYAFEQATDYHKAQPKL
ncbi:MAG TPA: Asp-tRNA(Asn)/Glu-tRNA(Gln) amidotransferase subunit GatA [Firmicutes bacterium]|nr:Asp-tRNA(Asn)/Glu-tRNA(Gln) amidotransferase subunit GatA [Bacillota bacterium]